MTKIVDGSMPHTLSEVKRALEGRVVRTVRISDIEAIGEYDGIRWNRVGRATRAELFPDYVRRCAMIRTDHEIAAQARRIIVTVEKPGREFPDHVWFDRCVWEVAE